MVRKNPARFLVILLSILLISSILYVSEAKSEAKTGSGKEQAPVSLSEGMGDAMIREATRMGEEFQVQARSLFTWTRPEWDWNTIDFLYKWGITLPLKIPVFMKHVMEQGRVLGVVGSLIVLTFISAVLYSLLGQKRVLMRVEKRVQPLRERMPESSYPYFLSILRVVVASLIPLLLLGAFSLINAFIKYDAPWFLLLERLLKLWVVGTLLINLLRESLVRDLFPVTTRYGQTIFNLSRIVLFYVLGGLAVYGGAEAFSLREDVLALLQFVVSLSIVCVLFLLLLKKDALLSLIPELPYRSYRAFLRGLHRYYNPLIFLSFLTALLWCIGYKQFGRALLIKTWAVAGTYVAIMLLYHVLQGRLQKWSEKKEILNEEAQFLLRSVRAMLLYATVTATILITLKLLGLFGPLQRIMSFPVLKIGDASLSFWIVIKAAIILLAFTYATRMLQAYLDYKVYPAMGLDPGLAYALNTSLKYSILAIGFLIALRVVGLDLRVLMVFAGAIGIGIGFGLQNMAANVISGFSLIFGQKIRKGDWIQVGDNLGVVTDIYLRATKVRTRDNIEYLIPNADFISNTIINYTLSSPMIRVRIPVGVSYDADPEAVRKILLECTGKHSMVTEYRAPEVRFVECADNSVNLEVLVWFDVRKAGKGALRSRLYFTIFEALKNAGIEIPFPQRDLHIRSGWARPEALRADEQVEKESDYEVPELSTAEKRLSEVS